jgi:hypothetical protein
MATHRDARVLAYAPRPQVKVSLKSGPGVQWYGPDRAKWLGECWQEILLAVRPMGVQPSPRSSIRDAQHDEVTAFHCFAHTAQRGAGEDTHAVADLLTSGFFD